MRGVFAVCCLVASVGTARAGSRLIELPCGYVPGEVLVYRYSRLTLVDAMVKQHTQWDVTVEVESWDGTTAVLRALHGPHELLQAAPDDTISPVLLASAARYAEHHPNVTRYAVDHATSERTILNQEEVFENRRAQLDAAWMDVKAADPSVPEAVRVALEHHVTQNLLQSIDDELSELVRHRCRSVSSRGTFSDAVPHPMDLEPLPTAGTVRTNEKRHVVVVKTEESVGDLTNAQLEPFRALLPAGTPQDEIDSLRVGVVRHREVAVHGMSSWPTSWWVLTVTHVMTGRESGPGPRIDHVQVAAIDHKLPAE